MTRCAIVNNGTRADYHTLFLNVGPVTEPQSVSGLAIDSMDTPVRQSVRNVASPSLGRTDPTIGPRPHNSTPRARGAKRV